MKNKVLYLHQIMEEEVQGINFNMIECMLLEMSVLNFHYLWIKIFSAKYIKFKILPS